jgi:hypothetical protein
VALTIDQKSFQGPPIKDSFRMQAFCPTKRMAISKMITVLHRERGLICDQVTCVCMIMAKIDILHCSRKQFVITLIGQNLHLGRH